MQQVNVDAHLQTDVGVEPEVGIYTGFVRVVGSATCAWLAHIETSSKAYHISSLVSLACSVTHMQQMVSC